MTISIITGASSGIGAEYIKAVTELYPEIDELWLIARRIDKLNEQAKKYPLKKCVLLPLDLSKKESLEVLQNKLEETKPEIKVLINDAGCGEKVSFENQNLDDMMKIVELNCMGLIGVTKVCLPYILEKGTIVQLSSTSAFVPNTNLIVYCASKSFVKTFSLGLNEELKKRKINVCTVYPGLIMTDIVKDLSGAQRFVPKVSARDCAYKSLRAAKRGKKNYTTGLFYKIYRVICKVLPQELMVKFAGF